MFLEYLQPINYSSESETLRGFLYNLETDFERLREFRFRTKGQPVVEIISRKNTSKIVKNSAVSMRFRKLDWATFLADARRENRCPELLMKFQSLRKLFFASKSKVTGNIF